MSEFDDLFDDVIDTDGESENADNEFAFDESQFEDKPEENSSEETEEKQEKSKPEDDEGEEMMVTVQEVTPDEVIVDGNHPLAGVVLHFDVTVTAVRDATEEEIEHGHAHGEGGHHH